ncbi:MAG TPA: glycosyltransferase [Ideonella sp.]|nr:glycosyltransferase [Ideonella sp.]
MSDIAPPVPGLDDPPLPRAAARPQRVALVMIVRDEAPRIAAALASALPHVDFALVLDTGSRDDTVQRARAAGARVEHFTWVDDFAAARNHALALAGADWHLVLDADETLQRGAEQIAALRRQAPDFVGVLQVDSHFGDGPASAVAPSWLSRVLPGAVRYAGRVHEQPQHRLPLRRLPVAIAHSGYRPEALAAKSGRNAALLQAALASDPGDAYLWYQLGKDHDVYERYADALDAFDQAQALLGGASPGWKHDLAVRSLHALKRCGRHAEAIDRAEAGLAAWGESPDFFFALGDLLLDWAADEPARADELLPMIESAWQRCLEIGERPELEGAVSGRGSVLAARNLALFYENLGREQDAAACRALAGA